MCRLSWLKPIISNYGGSYEHNSSFDTTIDGFKKFIKGFNLSKVENNIKYTFISMEPTELTQNGKCRRTLQRTQLPMTLREFYRNNKHAV